MKQHRHSGKYKSRTPRGRTVYKRRPKHKHTMQKKHRDIFQKFDRKPYEVGGYIDYNDKGFERADLYVGDQASVDIEITPDKEIDYHTHPTIKNRKRNKMNHFPTKDDVLASKQIPSQTMLIFHDGKVTVANKQRNFKPSARQLDKIEDGLERDANRMTVKELMKKYRPAYKKLGIDLKYITSKGAFKIPFATTEPVRKKKSVTKKQRQSLFHAGDEPPSELLDKGGTLFGFSNIDDAEGWRKDKDYDKIYQFQTDNYALDDKSYNRESPLGRRQSDDEFVAGNVLYEEEVDYEED